jgi:phosphoribosyl 1,2-cyclic phosphate phosphodiesterase
MGQTFRYIFDAGSNVNASFVPTLVPAPIEPGRELDLFGRPWLPLRLMHGRLPIVGFRIGDVAYCTDVSSVPPETWPLLEGLDVLVIDALRYRHHPTHLTVDQALAIVDQLQPGRAYFTHIAHDIKHADLEPKLPEHVYLAYDGITIESDG